MKSSTASPDTAQPKRQGIIRTEAIIPLVVVLALVFAYGMLFLDTHLRQLFEFAATRVNGAEVNVGDLKTDFRNATLELTDVQVTNPKEPTHNLLQVGTLRFDMLWDALLRGKVVVEQANVSQVGVNTVRARPGRVLPGKVGVTNAAESALADFKDQIASNVLGDLAAIAEGADPREQLAKLGDKLASSARLAELQSEFERKEAEWRKRIDALPKSETIKALDTRLRALKVDRFKNVEEVQASLQELQAIRDELDDHNKNVRGVGGALTADVKAYRATYAELEQTVRKDIADLKAHFGMPKLNAPELSKALFGSEVMQKVAEARGYMDQARAYLPPERSEEEKESMRPTPHPRAEGTDYVYGRPNAYPRMWLKKAVISSSPDQAGFAGQVSGELSDFTTEPRMIGRPMVAKLNGDFPSHGVRAATAELIVDHTKAQPHERLTVQVGGYDIKGRQLVTNDALSLGFEHAVGEARFTGDLQGEKVSLELNNDFTNVGYQVAARSAMVQEIVHDVVKGIPRVNVNAKVSGTWQDLNLSLTTNLASELQKGFQRMLQAKIAEAQARIESMVRERIAAERKKLEAQVASAEDQLKAQVAARQAEVDKVRAELDKRKTELENQKKAFVKTQEQKLKNEAGKLLNGIKF